jgi:cell division protein FtsB
MKNIPEQIQCSKKIAANVVLFLLLIYFVFHSIYGKLGVIAYFKLNKQLVVATQKLELLKSTRIDLEHKTKLMRTESLDKDMLDEQARKSLSVASPNDLMFVPSTEGRIIQ